MFSDGRHPAAKFGRKVLENVLRGRLVSSDFQTERADIRSVAKKSSEERRAIEEKELVFELVSDIENKFTDFWSAVYAAQKRRELLRTGYDDASLEGNRARWVSTPYGRASY